jgi:raffinose/stachyose/melibiose transport system permease protein
MGVQAEKVVELPVTGAAGSIPRRPPRSLWQELWRARVAYFLLAPILLLLAVFMYFPPLSGFYHAFFSWDGSNTGSFVGFDNFQRSLGDPAFWQECWNMGRLVVAGAVTAAFFPLVIALLIFHVRNITSKALYRFLVILPVLIPGIVTILIWRYLYDPNLGLINAFLRFVGLPSLAHDWLGDYRTALYALMFIAFPWLNGVNTLIYLAGLGNIPPEVLEAAELDGCTGPRRVRGIEIPLIVGQIKLLLTLAVIAGIQGFDTILVLTNGGPGTATMVPAMRMYQEAFTANDMGYASSVGLLLFIACFVLTLFVNRPWQRAEALY